jgi:hypothetical protein
LRHVHHTEIGQDQNRQFLRKKGEQKIPTQSHGQHKLPCIKSSPNLIPLISSTVAPERTLLNVSGHSYGQGVIEQSTHHRQEEARHHHGGADRRVTRVLLIEPVIFVPLRPAKIGPVIDIVEIRVDIVYGHCNLY